MLLLMGVAKRYKLILLCGLLWLIGPVCIAHAVPPDYNEEQTPATGLESGANPSASDRNPAPHSFPPTIERDPNREAPTEPGGERYEQGGADEDQGAPKPSVTKLDNGDIDYIVRSGDTLGTVAEMFHLDPADIARANHMRPDDGLLSGERLRLPNPFAAQDKALKEQVQQLSDEIQQSHQKIEAAEAETRRLQSSSSDLTAELQESQHDAEVLPWWRGLAGAAGVVSVLLAGIALLMFFDWLLLRRRYRSLAQMNESFRRLDQKYKETVAKAELRFQQLYGRRRAATGQDDDLSKIPEEYEIDRLNHQLGEILENNADKLGSAPGIPGRKRESPTGPGGTAEARSSRR